MALMNLFKIVPIEKDEFNSMGFNEMDVLPEASSNVEIEKDKFNKVDSLSSQDMNVSMKAIICSPEYSYFDCVQALHVISRATQNKCI